MRNSGGRSRTELVLLSLQKGYGIYDTLNDSFIGFQKFLNIDGRKEGGAKALWKTPGQAKSAFKLHTGIFFANQSQYEIRTV